MARQVALAGKRVPRRRQPEIVADDGQQVLGVAAVVDGEGGVEPDAFGVAAQQARADTVERPRPADRGRTLRRPSQDAAEDARRPPLHLHRRPARERQQQDPLRIGTPAHEVRHAMREGVGLARTGAGDDQQRSRFGLGTEAVLDRAALLRVQRRQAGVGTADGRVGRWGGQRKGR